MTNGAQPSGSLPTYKVLRELGKRAQRSFAALRDRNELLVIQRFTKSTSAAAEKDAPTLVRAEAMALLLRDARCLSKNWHPNVARVRHVDLVDDELTIATELVEGVTLADLIEIAKTRRASERDPVLALPLVARVIVDVLGGLHGLHGLRDQMNAPLGVFHGELCPANIIIGKDGVARVAHVFRPHPVKVTAHSEGLAYASPETLGGENQQDCRADIYSVGAILWEGLTGRPLFEEGDPTRIAQRQREEELPRPDLPASSPFARLLEVTMRALIFDPALRYRTASEMATDVRRIAGTRLAPGSAVAQTVLELAGERIRARRADLDPSSSGARRAAAAAGRKLSLPPPMSAPPPMTRRDPTDEAEETGTITTAAPMPDFDSAPKIAAASPAPAPTASRAPAPPPAAAPAPPAASRAPAPAPAASRAPAPAPAPAASRAPAPAPAPALASPPAAVPVPVPVPVAVPAPALAPVPAPARAPAPAASHAPRPMASRAPSPSPAAVATTKSTTKGLAPPTAATAATKTSAKETARGVAPPPAKLDDPFPGPRGSDPNVVEVPPLTAPIPVVGRTRLSTDPDDEPATLLHKAPIDDSDTIANERAPVPLPPAVAKLLVSDVVINKPPPEPFALTPSARPPPMAPSPMVDAPKIEMPKPIVGVPRPRGAEPDVRFEDKGSERIDLGSVDMLEVENPAESMEDVAPPSSGRLATPIELAALDDEPKQKFHPVFPIVAGVAVLVLLVAGIASLGAGKDEAKKTAAPSSSSAPASSASHDIDTPSNAGTATTETVTPETATPSPPTPPETATTAAAEPPEPPPPPPPPVKTAAPPPPPPPPVKTAAPPPPPPRPPPVAVAPPPVAAKPAATPKPPPPAPTPPKKPKKPSYEPQGI